MMYWCYALGGSSLCSRYTPALPVSLYGRKISPVRWTVQYGMLSRATAVPRVFVAGVTTRHKVTTRRVYRLTKGYSS